VAVELEEVSDLHDGGDEDQLQGGEEGVVDDGQRVALDMVNILLILVDYLISVQHKIPPKKTREGCSKTKAKKSVDGLDENDEAGSDSKPLEEVLVGHVTDKVIILCLGDGEVEGGKGEVEEVKSVERDKEKKGGVQEKTKTMVECIVLGEGGAGLQLVKDQVHLTPPLHIFGDRVIALQLPDAAEAGEQLRADRVAVEDGCAEEAEEEGRGEKKKIVEVCVRIGEKSFLALRAEIHPVPSTVSTGGSSLAAGRHASQFCCSKEDPKDGQAKDKDNSREDSV